MSVGELFEGGLFPRITMRTVRVAADVCLALSLLCGAWYAFSAKPAREEFAGDFAGDVAYGNAKQGWANTHAFLRTFLLVLFVSTAVLLLIRALGWRAASTVKENP